MRLAHKLRSALSTLRGTYQRFTPPPGFPPGPEDPPLAQLRAFSAGPTPYYRKLSRRFGPVFSLQLFGQDPWLVVGEPSLVRLVFKANADELHGDPDAVKFLLGPESIIVKNGEDHRRERRILTPPFKLHRIARYAEPMGRHADEALDALRPGQRLSAHEFFAASALETIIECIFGITDQSVRERLLPLFAEHMHDSQSPKLMAASFAMGGDEIQRLLIEGTRIARRFGLHEGELPRGGVLRYFAIRAAIAELLAGELAKLKSSPSSERDDVLGLLVAGHYDDGSRMSDSGLVDELFSLLVGGHETSAITMAWVLYYLAKNPEARERAQSEIRARFPDGIIDSKAVDQLTYLTAVIEETMRLAPVAPAVARRLGEGMSLPGYDLPPGTRGVVSPPILHYREDLFPEPDAFRPERFLDKRPSAFEYIPFGGGSRGCLGRPFAMMQMRVVLARVLDRLDYELAPDADPQHVTIGILSGPSDGVPIVAKAIAPREARLTSTRAAVEA